MKPKMIRASVEVNCSEILLHREEYVTIWLVPDKREDTIQVEIRITKEGIPEIYCDELEVHKFSDWYGD